MVEGNGMKKEISFVDDTEKITRRRRPWRR